LYDRLSGDVGLIGSELCGVCFGGIYINATPFFLNSSSLRASCSLSSNRVLVVGTFYVSDSVLNGSFTFKEQTCVRVDKAVSIILANDTEEDKNTIFKLLFFDLAGLPDLILGSVDDKKRLILEKYFVDTKRYIGDIKVFAD
jgi:hypothetical protein